MSSSDLRSQSRLFLLASIRGSQFVILRFLSNLLQGLVEIVFEPVELYNTASPRLHILLRESREKMAG